MKWIKLLVWVSALLIAGLVYSQTRAPSEALPPLNLPLAPAEAVAQGGTFWLYSASSGDDALPPFPWDPYEGVMPIYTLPDLPGQFLIGDTKQDWADLQALQRSLRLLESSGSTMALLSGDFPELPGDDEEGGGEGSTNEFNGMVFGTNDLWLEITTAVSNEADFLIHSPDEAAYDLFSTTNLALEVPGLNATNWVWLLRSGVGQTNITITSIWPEIGFFRLGTMLDSDSDGLTDAFEQLVSHSATNSANPDGDDLNDYGEYLLGRNPNAAGTVADTGNVVGLQLFTQLR